MSQQQHHVIGSIGYNSDSESESECESLWSDDDEDRFRGDAEWEVTRAAKAWEERRLKYAEAMIKLGNEEEALKDIRFLYVEEEEEEACVTCKPNWDWEHYDSDNSSGSDSDSDSDSY